MALPRTPHAAKHRGRGTNEERTRELDENEREFSRARRRLLWETLLGCVASCALGLFLVAWALHTTDPIMGGISFWIGLLAGDVGMLMLLLRFFRRTQEDG